MMEQVVCALQPLQQTGAAGGPSSAGLARAVHDLHYVGRLGKSLASLLSHIDTDAADKHPVLAEVCTMAGTASAALILAAVSSVGPWQGAHRQAGIDVLVDLASTAVPTALATARELCGPLLPILCESIVRLLTRPGPARGCMGNSALQGKWHEAAAGVLKALQGGRLLPDCSGAITSLLSCLMAVPPPGLNPPRNHQLEAGVGLCLWVQDLETGIDGQASAAVQVHGEVMLTALASAARGARWGMWQPWGWAWVRLTRACAQLVTMLPAAPETSLTDTARLAWHDVWSLAIEVLASEPTCDTASGPLTAAAAASAVDWRVRLYSDALLLLSGFIGRGFPCVLPMMLVCGGSQEAQLSRVLLRCLPGECTLSRMEAWLRITAVVEPQSAGLLAASTAHFVVLTAVESIKACLRCGPDWEETAAAALSRGNLPSLMATIRKCIAGVPDSSRTSYDDTLIESGVCATACWAISYSAHLTGVDSGSPSAVDARATQACIAMRKLCSLLLLNLCATRVDPCPEGPLTPACNPSSSSSSTSKTEERLDSIGQGGPASAQAVKDIFCDKRDEVDEDARYGMALA